MAIEVRTIIQLLVARVEPPVLATAIEKQGLVGWDLYGRFGKFGPKSDTAKAALTDLAKAHSAILRSRTEEGWGNWMPEFLGRATPISFLGWHVESLPKFDEIRAGLGEIQLPPPTPGIRESSFNSIVGGLLFAYTGELEGKKVKDLQKQDALIALMVEKLNGFQGISTSNLEKVFAEARRHLKRHSVE